MGTKSTTNLTRKDAEDMYVSFRQDEMTRILRAEAVLLNNKQLEDKIEEMNDKTYDDGYGFDNYLITGE